MEVRIKSIESLMNDPNIRNEFIQTVILDKYIARRDEYPYINWSNNFPKEMLPFTNKVYSIASTYSLHNENVRLTGNSYSWNKLLFEEWW